MQQPEANDLLELYDQANRYLNEGLIRTSWPEEPNPRKRREWMEEFLPALGHPQRAFDAVHVAGTSGKGSVSVMLAEILRAAGLRAGLHVTPYVQLSTEKLWVDGRYASAAELAALVEWIRPACEQRRGPHVPLHGMASVGVFLEHFRRGRVELGVVETGVGGRNDLTNVLQTRVAVITSVGLDHVKTLGPTLADIAWHKAGIIRPGCRAVVLEGAGVAAASKQAADVGAPLRVLRRRAFRGQAEQDGTVRLWFSGNRLQLEGAPLAMPGLFQAENAALAAAAVEELDPEGRRIPAGAVAEGLSRARLPGRLELVPPSPLNPCPVLLDGAHNPDKLAAALGAVGSWPRRPARLHVVYGSLAAHTPDDALGRLADAAHTLVLTEPQVYAKAPRPTNHLRAAVAGHPRALERPDPAAALDLALERAAAGDLLLVTGSLYLCGQLRDRWYPRKRVLAERRSWF
jgi:dihydrofolate synthase/folylpolyglutamate synthase